jgi:hypothetical protein
MDMKKGQVYVCEGCGLELQVKKGCTGCTKCDPCAFVCCGREMKLKKQE